MAESAPNRKKTLWEKGKLLIASNFPFSHCVYKRQIHKKQGLFGKGSHSTEDIVGKRECRSLFSENVFPRIIKPFPNDKFWTLANSKSAKENLNLMKVAECSPNG